VNPAVGFEDVDVRHDDLAFVRSIVGLLATDGRRGAGIDSEFEVKDRKLDASAIEAVPMRFDDVDNGGANVGCDVRADGEVLCKFGKVSLAVPYMDVGADVGERFRWVAEGFAKLLEFEDAVVNIIAVVHRNVTVNRLRAPDLGRNVDGKGTGCRTEERRGIGKRVRWRNGQRAGRCRNSSSSSVVVDEVIVVAEHGTGN
jgi:hypothetical protein